MIKDVLKKNPMIMDVVALVYNMIFSKCRIMILTGRIHARGAFLRGTKVRMCGKGCVVNIGRMARLRNCQIICHGNECSLIIGGGRTIITNTVFFEEDDNCSIDIGRHFTMEGGHIAATEGETITIGEDCMFSSDVEIRNGDSHVIMIKDTRKRINKAKPVEIGNHVWLTAHVKVLKGSSIANNCIAANSAVVSGKFDTPNCIYGGSPVRILKENIDWNRFRNDNWEC